MSKAGLWSRAILVTGLIHGIPFSIAVQAETLPFPGEVIRGEVTRMVPSPWSVEDVTVEPVAVDLARLPAIAPEKDKGKGKAASQPVTEPTRVAAEVIVRLKLAQPTYMVDSRIGPVTFVRSAVDPKIEKSLRATVHSVHDGRGWITQVQLHNPDVFDGIGRPSTELPGQVVVLGTEEARQLQERLGAEERARVEAETERRRLAEELAAQQDAAVKAERERLERERLWIETRSARVTQLRDAMQKGARSTRVATLEAALGGNDPALRQFAVETALQSRDPVLTNLVLKDWLSRKTSIPVMLYATKEDASSETVLQNLGPLTIDIERFNIVSGSMVGRMGAAGYSITNPSAASGALAQNELTINNYGCTLSLRLSEQATMDGLFRCQTLPTLVARITLD